MCKDLYTIDFPILSFKRATALTSLVIIIFLSFLKILDIFTILDERERVHDCADAQYMFMNVYNSANFDLKDISAKQTELDGT